MFFHPYTGAKIEPCLEIKRGASGALVAAFFFDKETTSKVFGALRRGTLTLEDLRVAINDAQSLNSQITGYGIELTDLGNGPGKIFLRHEY